MDEATSSLTRKEVNALFEVIHKLKDEGVDPEIKALCWMQGESDADSDKASLYYDRLSSFVGDFREEFKDYASEKGIGFIDAGISDCFAWALNKEINASKKKFADESEINEYIDTQSMQLEYNKEPYGNVDIYHYDSDAMIELGHAFGDILLNKFM